MKKPWSRADRLGLASLFVGVAGCLATLAAVPPRRPPTLPPPSPLAGTWRIEHTIQSTKYRQYAGLAITYEVTLEVRSGGVVGEGHKQFENGFTLPRFAQTPIHLQGTIDGDVVRGTYTEEGALRLSHGAFEWRVSGSEASGTFRSTAAASSGLVRAKRAV